MGCSSALSIRLLALALSVSLLFTPSSGHGHSWDPYTNKAEMIHHEGPMLTGNVKLGFMWYGDCGKDIKNTMRNFVKSLELPGKDHLQPQVTRWWEVVESYQSLMPGAKPGKSPKINVEVAKQDTSKSYKLGKVLTLQVHIPILIEELTKGDVSILPVIVAARDVSIQGLCSGKCADHLLTGNQFPFLPLNLFKYYYLLVIMFWKLQRIPSRAHTSSSGTQKLSALKNVDGLSFPLYLAQKDQSLHHQMAIWQLMLWLLPSPALWLMRSPALWRTASTMRTAPLLWVLPLFAKAFLALALPLETLARSKPTPKLVEISMLMAITTKSSCFLQSGTPLLKLAGLSKGFERISHTKRKVS